MFFIFRTWQRTSKFNTNVAVNANQRILSQNATARFTSGWTGLTIPFENHFSGFSFYFINNITRHPFYFQLFFCSSSQTFSSHSLVFSCFHLLFSLPRPTATGSVMHWWLSRPANVCKQKRNCYESRTIILRHYFLGKLLCCNKVHTRINKCEFIKKILNLINKIAISENLICIIFKPSQKSYSDNPFRDWGNILHSHNQNITILKTKINDNWREEFFLNNLFQLGF